MIQWPMMESVLMCESDVIFTCQNFVLFLFSSNKVQWYLGIHP